MLIAVLPIAVLIFAIWTGAGTMPYDQDFESLNSGNLDGQDGWVGSPVADVAVEAGAGFGGGKAAVIQATAVTYQGFTNTLGTNIWVEFYTKFTVRAENPSLENDAAVAFYAKNDGYIYAISNTSWVALTNTTVGTADWYRVTLNLDYISSNWSIYISGNGTNTLAATLAENLKFYDRTATNRYIRRFKVGN